MCMCAPNIVRANRRKHTIFHISPLSISVFLL